MKENEIHLRLKAIEFSGCNYTEKELVLIAFRGQHTLEIKVDGEEKSYFVEAQGIKMLLEFIKEQSKIEQDRLEGLWKIAAKLNQTLEKKLISLNYPNDDCPEGSTLESFRRKLVRVWFNKEELKKTINEAYDYLNKHR